MKIAFILALVAFCLISDLKGELQKFQATTPQENQYITVMGEVVQPTKIQTDRGIKLTKVLEFCGGLTSKSDERHIVVFGTRGIEIHDLRMIKNTSRDPLIRLGDTVYVRDH